MKTSTSLLLALTLLLPATALAVPQTVGFSARLADNGRPVTGTHAFTFKVFNVETGGTEVWGEAKDLAVADGVVTTALGDTVPIDTYTLFTGLAALYLEVTVDGVALSPRMALQSVPFALRAQSAAFANFVPWEGVVGKPGFYVTSGNAVATLPSSGSHDLYSGSFTPSANASCMVMSTGLVSGVMTSSSFSYLYALLRNNTTGTSSTGFGNGWAPFPAPAGGYTSTSVAVSFNLTASNNYSFGCQFGTGADIASKSAQCKWTVFCSVGP